MGLIGIIKPLATVLILLNFSLHLSFEKYLIQYTFPKALTHILTILIRCIQVSIAAKMRSSKAHLASIFGCENVTLI